MARFKKGDRIVAIETDIDGMFKKGDTGTITENDDGERELIWTIHDGTKEQHAAYINKIELIKRGKMKEQKKMYPKKVYVQFNCEDNADDLTLRVDYELKDKHIHLDRKIAVYEFKKLIMVEMRPHIKDVKE